MNSHELIRTAVKLTGMVLFIYATIQAASSIPFILDQYSNTEISYPIISFAGAIVIPLLFSLLLWLFPARVTDTIIKDDLKPTPNNEFLLGIEKVGIRILGLYLLYHGISDLVANYASYRQAIGMFDVNISFASKDRYITAFITTGVEILMSFLLILGASGITNIIRKIRYAS